MNYITVYNAMSKRAEENLTIPKSDAESSAEKLERDMEAIRVGMDNSDAVYDKGYYNEQLEKLPISGDIKTWYDNERDWFLNPDLINKGQVMELVRKHGLDPYTVDLTPAFDAAAGYGFLNRLGRFPEKTLGSLNKALKIVGRNIDENPNYQTFYKNMLSIPGMRDALKKMNEGRLLSPKSKLLDEIPMDPEIQEKLKKLMRTSTRTAGISRRAAEVMGGPAE